MLDFLKNLFERKSGTLPTKEHEAYFSNYKRLEHFNFSRAEQDLIVSKVFQNRYNLLSNTQPLRTAVDYIALGIQNVPIKLMKRSANTKTPDYVIENKSQILACDFDNPSGIYDPTINTLLYKITKEYYLNGSYCIYYNKDSHVFYVIPANQYIMNRTDSVDKINIWLEFRNERYAFDILSGAYINQGNQNELMFLFDKDPWLKPIEKSILSSIATEICLYNAANIYSLDLYQNAGANSILSVDGINTGDERDKIQKFVSDALNNARKNSQSVFLPFNGVKLLKVKDSIGDMSYLEISNNAKNAIFQAFGTHPSLFTGEAATMDNFRQARQAVWHNIIIPLIEEIVSNIQKVLFTANDIDERTYYLTIDRSLIPVIQESEQDRMITLHKEGLITENESRELIGYNRIEGGDTLRVQTNMIPIGTDDIFNSHEGI